MCAFTVQSQSERLCSICRGVGQAKVVGRIHMAQIKCGSAFLGASFVVLENQSMDFLFGLGSSVTFTLSFCSPSAYTQRHPRRPRGLRHPYSLHLCTAPSVNTSKHKLGSACTKYTPNIALTHLDVECLYAYRCLIEASPQIS